MTQVLIVSDDLDFSEELTEGLRNKGFEIHQESSMRPALEKSRSVDAVILDLTLSEIDGFEACQALRATSRVPVIVMGLQDDEFDQILSFKLGADDYIVRPCSMRKLAARIQAMHRRARNSWELWEYWGLQAERDSEVHEFGPVRIDMDRRMVLRGEREVTLTRKEFDVLALLATNPGRVCTREQIMSEVWGHDGSGDTRTLGVHMTGLRKKLGLPTLIETVRGIGFRLAAHRISEGEAA
ncbi:response regulator transcription factor [Streptomyces beihaiensis]|uniref:Sensory transduction protein RegX3 n=1 Tax=Streptomyces beihaiensis TaxID=2984495 RepID=A0ABT3TYN3_9ACTN|nr:response regulator transcription factor [Streptomyces beihaiensis]MCX3062164.1 response regulator transcription factor [Streptomyces beihaiensis]